MKKLAGVPLIGVVALWTSAAFAQESPPPSEEPPEAQEPGQGAAEPEELTPAGDAEAPTASPTNSPEPEPVQPPSSSFEPTEEEPPAEAASEPPQAAFPAAEASPTSPQPTAQPLAPRPESTAAPEPATAPSSSTTSSRPPPSSPPPPPSSTPPPSSEGDEDSGGGIYFDADLAGTYGFRSTHEWNHSCPEVEADSASWNPSCSATAPLGLAMEGRLGIRVGALGIEGFGLGAIDWSTAKLGGEQPPVDIPGMVSDMQIGRVGGGLGGGLRLMSNGIVRVSAGVGGGIMFRHVFTNVSSLDGSSTGYTAPIVKGDLSLTIGNFLNLGVLGWVEFSPQVEVTPNLGAASGVVGFDPNDPNITATLDAFENALGDVTVFEGPQFFLGPYLGLHFGN